MQDEGDAIKAIAELEKSQVELLVRLWDSPNRSGFIRQDESRNISVLEKNNLVNKLGRIGFQTQWQASKGLLGKPIEFAKEVLGIFPK